MRRLLAGVFLLGLLGCQSEPPPKPAASGGLNVLVPVAGQVSIKRAGWQVYAPALLGTPVGPGDLLRLEEGAQARVVCADLTVLDVPRVGGTPCRVAQPVLVYAGGLASAPREPPGDFPRVVSPRKSRLRDPRPTVRWTAIQGAGPYTVSVSGAGVAWSRSVVGTTTAYPAEAPPLQPGRTYTVTVRGGGRSSDEEGVPGLGFTLLRADEAERLAQSESRIAALGLVDAPTRLLVAELYRSQGLLAEAIEQLERLADATREPAVRRSLADAYLRVDLSGLAAEQYTQAAELSRELRDTEGEALALRTRAAIDHARGDAVGARTRWSESRALYERLGDARAAEEIAALISGLERP